MDYLISTIHDIIIYERCGLMKTVTSYFHEGEDNTVYVSCPHCGEKHEIGVLESLPFAFTGVIACSCGNTFAVNVVIQYSSKLPRK